MKAVALQIQSFCSAILFVLQRNFICFAAQFKLFCTAISIDLRGNSIYFAFDMNLFYNQ